MDKEIVVEPPREEEAPTQRTDAPTAAASASATGEAGGAPEEPEAEVPLEPTGARVGGERTPSPQRAPEAGNEGGAPTSPQAAPDAAVSPRQEASGASTRIEAVVSPRQEASGASTRIEASAPSSGA